jgi:hypothetical protein
MREREHLKKRMNMVGLLLDSQTDARERGADYDGVFVYFCTCFCHQPTLTGNWHNLDGTGKCKSVLFQNEVMVMVIGIMVDNSSRNVINTCI